jgi:hypothetical protein
VARLELRRQQPECARQHPLSRVGKTGDDVMSDRCEHSTRDGEHLCAYGALVVTLWSCGHPVVSLVTHQVSSGSGLPAFRPTGSRGPPGKGSGPEGGGGLGRLDLHQRRQSRRQRRPAPPPCLTCGLRTSSLHAFGPLPPPPPPAPSPLSRPAGSHSHRQQLQLQRRLQASCQDRPPPGTRPRPRPPPPASLPA